MKINLSEALSLLFAEVNRRKKDTLVDQNCFNECC